MAPKDVDEHRVGAGVICARQSQSIIDCEIARVQNQRSDEGEQSDKAIVSGDQAVIKPTHQSVATATNPTELMLQMTHS